LPAIIGSIVMNPVTLPPGCARVATKPLPTGSVTVAKIMEMVRDCCSIDVVADVPCVRMRSGCSVTSSFAYRRINSRSASPSDIRCEHCGRPPTPAKVGEKLVTYNFGTGTRGFAAPEDCSVAVCLFPGTELAFETPVKYQTPLMFRANTGHTVAIFRQIHKSAAHTHHDALEFPDGEIMLLTRLCEGQKATVLTLFHAA